MAVSRKTQKDVGNYEAKFIGPFSARETVFLGIGIVISAIIGVFLEVMGTDFMTIAVAVLIIMSPFVWLAKAKPYGMRAEIFLKEYYVYHILSPDCRPYKTETGLDVMKWEDVNELTESEKKTAKKEKHVKDLEYPDYQ